MMAERDGSEDGVEKVLSAAFEMRRPTTYPSFNPESMPHAGPAKDTHKRKAIETEVDERVRKNLPREGFAPRHLARRLYVYWRHPILPSGQLPALGRPRRRASCPRRELGDCDVARVDPTEQELGKCDIVRVDPIEQELGKCDVVRVDPTEQELGNCDVVRVDPTKQELGKCNGARVDPTEQELGNCNVERVDPTKQELGNCNVARVDPTEQELGNCNVARVDPTERELGNCNVGFLPRVDPGVNPGVWVRE
ncbi:hypothetical protein B296_00035062 [Ensete ventricosum]|uniref:Uncharacterized protein n=1 Tax=Ensete ventricosum TaxID=4639 RepID=A0A426Y8V0_ENSVE|nr:hypothetical protein B296_00035062 [Ensete ventricosum]